MAQWAECARVAGKSGEGLRSVLTCRYSRPLAPSVCLRRQLPPGGSQRTPPHLLWCCGRGRGLPGPLVPWHCPGGFGRGKPLPYAQQRKKCGNFQGLFVPSPQKLRCQVTDRWEQRLTRVRPWESKYHLTEEWAPPTECLRHLCDPTRTRAEKRTTQGHPVPRGGFHKAGEGPAFGGLW